MLFKHVQLMCAELISLMFTHRHGSCMNASEQRERLCCFLQRLKLSRGLSDDLLSDLIGE